MKFSSPGFQYKDHFFTSLVSLEPRPLTFLTTQCVMLPQNCSIMHRLFQTGPHSLPKKPLKLFTEIGCRDVFHGVVSVVDAVIAADILAAAVVVAVVVVAVVVILVVLDRIFNLKILVEFDRCFLFFSDRIPLS